MQYILTDIMNLRGDHTIADNITPYFFFLKKTSMRDIPQLLEKCDSSKGFIYISSPCIQSKLKQRVLMVIYTIGENLGNKIKSTGYQCQ